MGKISEKYSEKAEAIINNGSCYDFVKTIPDRSVKLIVTSPPYNIGKKYEKKSSLKNYYDRQEQIIDNVSEHFTPQTVFWSLRNNFMVHKK
jgi:DNA modification methylase